MKTKLFLLATIVLFAISCSSTKDKIVGFGPDTIFESLHVGMTKQSVIELLGKDYKMDMNTVTQTADNYVETLIWNSKVDPQAAYALTFVNNKLSKKTRERVVQSTGGGNIQINR